MRDYFLMPLTGEIYIYVCIHKIVINITMKNASELLFKIQIYNLTRNVVDGRQQIVG